MTTKLFSELGLSPETLKAIDKLGFEQASPIQAAAIPVLMAGRDVVGQSQTGSGKTAAFGLPAIEKVDPQLRAVQVLILCPTRELAVQVSEDLHKLAAFKRGIHPLPIYGGQSYERQFQGLRQGAQIVIGTPGRLMDHMQRGTLRLDQVKVVILDEADVMLDMGFRDDIEVILKGAPKERQTVFFSATMPRPIQDLIQRYSQNAQLVKIEQRELTVPTVEQTYFEVDRRFKVELLTRLIDLHDLKLGIIFCNTKRMVDDLVEHLNAQGYSADRLHGDMTQMMRDRVMNRFRKSGLEFLVATDVAARGLDVDNVQVVFNYDLPYDAEDYLHRIGRTGRAGRSGMAISFASGREVYQIYQIERFIKVKMRRGKLPTAQEAEDARAGVLLDQVRATLQKGDFKQYEQQIARLLEEGFPSTDVASALLHMLQGQAAAKSAPAPEPASQRPDRPARRDMDPERDDRRFRQRSDSPPARQSFRERPPRVEHKPRPAAAPAPRAQAAAQPVAPEPAVAPRELPPGFPASREPHPKPAPAPDRKPSRRTPDEQTRLFMNVGEAMGIVPSDVVATIMGHTGLPASVVGTVDVRERHLFVDVASDHARAIISKLNRSQMKGQNLKVKVA
jgi:ATP-dependent RNA helicase DeaD